MTLGLYEIHSSVSSPSSLNLSNKSLPASPPGVGRVRGQGSHLLPPSPSRRVRGVQPRPTLRSSARPPLGPLSSVSVSTQAPDQSKCVQARSGSPAPALRASEGASSSLAEAPPGAGRALPAAATARDCNFLPPPELSPARGAAHPRARFHATAAPRPGFGGPTVRKGRRLSPPLPLLGFSNCDEIRDL